MILSALLNLFIVIVGGLVLKYHKKIFKYLKKNFDAVTQFMLTISYGLLALSFGALMVCEYLLFGIKLTYYNLDLPTWAFCIVLLIMLLYGGTTLYFSYRFIIEKDKCKNYKLS